MKLLETERILIRPWTVDDAADLFEYAHTKLVGPNAGWAPHKSIYESRKTIKDVLSQDDCAALELKSIGKVIGSVGLKDTCLCEEVRSLSSLELGYTLNPDFWGRGLMPEAVKELCRYAFDELNVDFLWCGHYDFNLRSKRVCEKSGFIKVFERNVTLKQLNDKKVREWLYILTSDIFKSI